VASNDADEDECLSLNELVPNLYDERFGRPVVRGTPGQPQPQQVVSFSEPGRIPAALTQQLIAKYDTNGDLELTREECGFDEPTFKRLDVDGGGTLDGEELEAWRTGPADLEVSLALATRAVDCVARLVSDREEAAARGFSVKQIEPGRLMIRTGRQPIEFWAFVAVLNYQPPALKVSYQSLFTQAAMGKDHLTEKDLARPNFQILRAAFEAADTDADGKLTKAEFDAYYDLQDSFRNTGLAITPAVQTPSLFQLLDENRDGRLSVRELRTSWPRLRSLEPGGGDALTKAAILPSVSLRLSRMQDRSAFYQQQYPYQSPSQARVPDKGPVWFRKMDRNADGDVSRAEFLGTKAEFEAIDTDRDGLIGLEESEAWDRKTRDEGDKK
jgi:hypothetical protein